MHSKDKKEAIIGIAVTIALTFLFAWGIYQNQLTDREKIKYGQYYYDPSKQIK